MSVALATRRDSTSSSRRTEGAREFVCATPVYWLSVYPQVRDEIARLRCRAAAIPDPELRPIALNALVSKRVNLDGAAAFAAFAPASRRAALVRAQLCFQAIYDYLDLLTEQRHEQAGANSRELHKALLAALTPACASAPSRSVGDLAASQPGLALVAALPDGGYLQELIASCRDAVTKLPAYATVCSPVERCARRIVEYQSVNDSGDSDARAELERWARSAAPAGATVAWWETAASGGSSLGLFALLALAASPSASVAQAKAIEEAYFPWIGALHSLLDSLIDLPEDIVTGQHSLIEHYGQTGQVAAGLRRLAQESRSRAGRLPQPGAHLAILAAMSAIYLTERGASASHARAARAQVLRTIGGLTRPAMAVMRARRLLLGR